MSRSISKFFFCGFVAMIFFASGKPVLAEETFQEIPRPTWSVGERWIYRHIDSLNKDKTYVFIFEVEAVLHDGRKRITVKRPGQPDEMKLYGMLLDADLNHLEFDKWTYSPAKPYHRFPLKLEGEWSYRFISRWSDSVAYHAATISAKGREQVTIAGRTYDTLRFEYVGLSGTGFALGYREIMKYWYAPSVKNIVAWEREYTGGAHNSYVEIWRRELIMYQPLASPDPAR